MTALNLEVLASHPVYRRMVEEPLLGYVPSQNGLSPTLVLDFPAGWALHTLDLPSTLRHSCVVYTQSNHPVYHDCLTAYRVSGIVTCTEDDAVLLGALHSVSRARPSVRPRLTHLTPMELRVVRCLLLGLSTNEAAAELGLAEKTINSHVSGALRKLDLENRGQLIAQVFTRYEREEEEAWTTTPK